MKRLAATVLLLSSLPALAEEKSALAEAAEAMKPIIDVPAQYLEKSIMQSLANGARGRVFESLRPDQILEAAQILTVFGPFSFPDCAKPAQYARKTSGQIR